MGRRLEGNCKEFGCEEPNQIRGYCQKHYAERRSIKKRYSKLTVAEYEHYLSLRRELSRAECMYKAVRATTQRVRWHHEIEEIQAAMATMEKRGTPKTQRKARRFKQWKTKI
ncbi:MAG: hypothetical protein DRP42_04790 [Tenericutes bacterium]|nr:MAG: hypothetical protein DRP42_04790 [Mycoplasmatota bacterium]